MRYRLSYYLDAIGQASIIILYALICWPAAFAVLFFGFFMADILMAFSVKQAIVDCISLTAGCYFLWTFAISIIDFEMEKDRDTL